MSLYERALRIPDHPTAIRARLKARLARLGSDQPLLAASLAHIRKRCGRKACRCHTQGELHTGWHLTYKVQGKTHTVYVPFDLLDDVRTWIDNHKRHKELLAEIHALTVALVRTHTQATRRQAGRPGTSGPSGSAPCGTSSLTSTPGWRNAPTTATPTAPATASASGCGPP